MGGTAVCAAALRWTGRATSLLSVGTLLLFAFGEGERGSAPRADEWLALALFPAGVAIGLLVAWWREGLGAAISVASLVAFYTLGAAQGRVPGGPWFAIFTSPSLAFAASWWLRRRSATTT